MPYYVIDGISLQCCSICTTAMPCVIDCISLQCWLMCTNIIMYVIGFSLQCWCVYLVLILSAYSAGQYLSKCINSYSLQCKCVSRTEVSLQCCLVTLIVRSQHRELVNGAYDRGYIAIGPNHWVTDSAIFKYLAC